MTASSQDNAQRYLAGLRQYLGGGGELALQSAYELGRHAIAEGLGALEMLAIHQHCVAIVLRAAGSAEGGASVVQQAGAFLAESLSPFEMALRGFREANARLSGKIDELRATHQELEAERRRYRDLFDSAPDGYLVTDMDAIIEEANRAAGSLLAVPREALTGTRLLQWVADEARAVFDARLKQLLRNNADRSEDWQFDIRTRTGACFPATLSVRVVRNAAGLPDTLRILLRDATERKRMEEERAQLLVREQVARAQWEGAQRAAFLAEISALLVASLDSETTMGGVARRIVPYLADSCLIYLVEAEDRLRLLCSAPADSPGAGQARRLTRDVVPIPPDSALAQVLEKGRPAVLSQPAPNRRETLEDSSRKPFGLPEWDFPSLMLAPVQSHGRVLGLIVLAATRPNCYHDDHVILAGDLAHRCALALDNAQLYRGMVAERDKAAEANRAKDEFLGILGHELRNPLVPVLGWARNLRKNPIVAEDPALSQGVEATERNALSILRLADDCLDLVRISERKVALEREPLDLNETIRCSIEALRQVARDKGLELQTRLAGPSLWVLGDRTRLEQVMNNLVINAVKYTGSGGAISVSSEELAHAAVIEIKDTGIGIAPEFLEQVFQPFRRGGREWLTADASLGLGLAIARKIVELHGGRIWAESPGLGGGSAFHVELPLAPAGNTAEYSRANVQKQEAKASPMRILLIDDQKDITDLMKMELENLGYSVITAADGQLGFETAMRCSPDVIVSDLKLPGIDGFELIQKLRATPGLAAIPVIAHTGLGARKHAEAALAAGFDAHLKKPAEVTELSNLLQTLGAARRAARPAS
jgi:PAS domain S-box-containing protein